MSEIYHELEILTWAQNQRTRRSTTRARKRTEMGTLIPFSANSRISILVLLFLDGRKQADTSIFQHQEAQDLPLPESERNRPQIPKKPQAFATRNDESA